MYQESQSVRVWGNSGGVLVPKDWIGKQVKIILIDRTEEIKKEVLEILEPYWEEIQGVYLVGSYARNEQKKESDIDILVITEKTRKTLVSGKYSIEIHTLQGIKNTLKNHPIMIYPRLIEAKPLVNKQLLHEILQSTKITKESFKEFIEECKRIIKINKELIELDKLYGNVLKSYKAIIYSLVLRLKGIYIMEKVLEQKKYSKEGFQKWMEKELAWNKKKFDEIYALYTALRDDKRQKVEISLQIGQDLLNLLQKEVNAYAKPKKTA